VTAIPSNALIIPTTDDPSQAITVTLANQSCSISLYTKSINVPLPSPVLPYPYPPLPPSPTPPTYENANPVFLDLYVDYVLIIGGVLVLNNVLIVRDSYLGFVGDLAVFDTEGEDDPFGVPARLPPLWLKNQWQLSIAPADAEFSPAVLANTILGMGSRFQLCYLPAS